MSVLKKISIKDQVYDLIKGRILDQTYQLGEKINMLELAKELEISNSPVREALSILESEGLVTFTPHAGPRVVEIDQSLFNEVQDTAKILLVGSYEQCIKKNLIPDLITLMRDFIAQQKNLSKEHSIESDYRFAQIAIEFDVSLIKILRNTTLERLYAAFFNLLFLVVLYDHQNYDVDRDENILEHEQILRAIQEGNHDDVKKYIELHFSRSIG
ncbi:transcriptional regulator NanR [uncultured Eubacterium sp.]|nr:transcriptional regulator NanR [uncultured Eubacterium sp.]